MDSTANERMSIALSTYIDQEITGTQEEVEIRRRAYMLIEEIENDSSVNEHTFFGGSRGEGLKLSWSDSDRMIIIKNFTVTYPGHFIPSSMTNNTILYMRDADCRRGYVHLQLGQLGRNYEVYNSLVKIKDSYFVSSDIYRECCVKAFDSGSPLLTWHSNGPSISVNTPYLSYDLALSFPCDCWPKDANEWISRTRRYGWPYQTLIDKIVRRGCHLVPVGDKCSEDTFLQWRISFATAERSLVHSFSHIQMKVYALLKCLLKEIKKVLKKTMGDDDILCSYFLKTTLFHAMENTNPLFWQEKHLFNCFWFCFNILIAWVRAGVCPNHFIPSNNMFQRKVHGLHQQILLEILNNFLQLKWMCLSVHNIFNPSIWENGACPRTEQELIFNPAFETAEIMTEIVIKHESETIRLLRNAIHLLSKSQSDFDDVFTYQYSLRCLQRLAAQQFCQDRKAMGNKTRYKSLRKCKNWMIHGASMGTELVRLATFHFLTGNFAKSLEMCKQVMKLASCFKYWNKILQEVMKEHKQSELSSWRLQKKIYSGFISFSNKDLYLPHLYLEMTDIPLYIPPLPYVIFLSFLCYHELRDTTGRDAALRKMIDIQSDEFQGGDKYGIVYNLLGICYEILGDFGMAIRAYWNSSKVHLTFPMYYTNAAIKRIAVVYLCMYASQKFNGD